MEFLRWKDSVMPWSWRMFFSRGLRSTIPSRSMIWSASIGVTFFSFQGLQRSRPTVAFMRVGKLLQAKRSRA
eukprot:11401711-Alexandrium_andersonii.AAC.1